MDEIKNENVAETVEEVAPAKDVEAPEAETAVEENAEVATTDAENAEATDNKTKRTILNPMQNPKRILICQKDCKLSLTKSKPTKTCAK